MGVELIITFIVFFFVGVGIYELASYWIKKD